MIKFQSFKYMTICFSLGYLCMAATSFSVEQNGSGNMGIPEKKNRAEDSFLMMKREPMKDPSQANAPTGAMTIVDIAVSNPSLSTFLKAVSAADLLSTLQETGPFTVFVPNDEAFAKLSPNTLADLLKLENKDKLASILTFHIVPGKIKASDMKTMKLKTINGKTLEIKMNGTNVSVNHAKVIKSDIIGSNGVIHIIDTVLIP